MKGRNAKYYCVCLPAHQPMNSIPGDSVK